MNSKNKIIIAVILIVIIMAGVISLTYAFFKATAKSGAQIITTTNMNLEIRTETPTHITGIAPTSWPSSLSSVNENKNISKIPFQISSTTKVNGHWSINLKAFVPKNTSYYGGNPSDIKFKIYEDDTMISEGNLTADFNQTILTGIMSIDKVLNESYILYIYIEENNDIQDTLKDIEFTVQLLGSSYQTD